jgi:ABC-type dipeptide/oligopeptide/nickel transport system permease subunit
MFVEAAASGGCERSRPIIFAHILPNCVGPIRGDR